MINLKEYEDVYGGNLTRSDRPCFGIIESIDPNTQLVSGSIVDMARNFNNAFVVMEGGAAWGMSMMPQPGDVVKVLTSINNVSFVTPFSANYGSAVANVDDAAALGFKRLIPGELHQHSAAHAEQLYDAMGDWGAYDSVGDFVYLDAANASLRMRAWNQGVQEYGFKADGTPVVTMTAGLQYANNSFYKDGTKPNPSMWRVDTDAHHLLMDGTPGSETFEYKNLVNNSLIQINAEGDVVITTAAGAILTMNGNTGDEDAGDVFLAHKAGPSLNIYADGLELVANDTNTNFMLYPNYAQIATSGGYSLLMDQANAVFQITADNFNLNADSVQLGSLDGQVPFLHSGFVQLYNLLLAALLAHEHPVTGTDSNGDIVTAIAAPSIELATLPGYVLAGQTTVTSPISPAVVPPPPTTPAPVNPLVTAQVTGD